MAENNSKHHNEKAQANPAALLAEMKADAAAEQERRKAAANSNVVPIELPKRLADPEKPKRDMFSSHADAQN